MKFFILFILSIAAIPFASAQDTFVPGFIITEEQDTINGYLLEKTDAELARKVIFKREKKGISKTYKPAELLGFGFDNSRIFRKMATILSPEEDTTYVFAKNLVKGKIDLYVLRYANQNNPDIFLINNNTSARVELSRPESRRFFRKNGKIYSPFNFSYVSKLRLIKGDSSAFDARSYPKYSERRIKNDILNYNRAHANEYPIEVYKEELKFNYDFLAGIPVSSSVELHFRVGVYRNKSRVERTTNFSVMQGIVYHHWSKDENQVPVIQEGNSNYRWQFLNVIPLGINFHGNSKIVQPYGYAGVGFGVALMNDHIIGNGEIQGEETKFWFSPTLNFGVGAKIRLGRTFLITELTPTINGLFWNAGFSL